MAGAPETIPPLPPRSVDFNALCADLKKGTDPQTAIDKAVTEPVAPVEPEPVAEAKAEPASKEG